MMQSRNLRLECRRGLLILFLPVVFFLVAAKPRAVARPPAADPPPIDAFSAAQLEDVQVRHVALDLTVDFNARRLQGAAALTIINFTGTRRLVLDTSALEIAGVTIDGRPATWRYGAATRWTHPLEIDINPTTRIVRIDYKTSVFASGLYWLTARQTRGDVAPFLFTQSEPIDTRSWIPIQDTPGLRVTYEATIRVPPGLMALMSATNPTETNASGVYRFTMDQPIAPYLIALAVGRLVFHAYDERTGVYAEPELIDDVIWDMQFLPGMVDAAETVLGPYPFGRYDLLFPPGFDAGGMENPRLNFLSDGLILGNREFPVPPSAVVAHELAHSWGGDLATCATWSDTWLNEGFATYYEKRFYEAMGLDERAEIGYYWDRTNYEGSMKSLSPASSTLHRTFAATVSPGTAFNVASYQKGSLFLQMLNDRLGRDAFDDFIEEYFQRNAFRWVDDQKFLHILRETALSGRPDLESDLKVNEWIYDAGLPSNVTAPTRSAIEDRVAVQAASFRSGTPAASLNTTGWGSLETVTFLPMIRDLIPSRMAELDAAFGFSMMKTPPIIWLVETAKIMYAPSMPALERFLKTGVSNVLAIYQTLAQTSSGRTWARAFYATVKDDYTANLQSGVNAALYGFLKNAA